MWLCGGGQEADVMPKDRKGEQLLVQKDEEKIGEKERGGGYV